MTTLDYILLAPIILGLIYGFIRGFFKELVLIVCVIVALYISRYFGEFMAISLSNILNKSINITKPISFTLIFIGTVLCLKILANILTKISKVVALSWFNRIMGTVLGGFKWLIITSIFLNILSFFYEKTNNSSSNRLAESRFYKPIESTIVTILPLLNFENFKNKNIINSFQNEDIDNE